MEQLPENTYQRREPFPDFMEHIDENMVRRAPTPEEKTQMNENIVQLGKLFGGVTANWHIDGALNISLLNGEYIGVHKDIDISVEEQELGELEQYLGSHGYGIFLVYPGNTKETPGERMYERLGGKDLLMRREGGLMICAVDMEGNIRDQTEATLNFIDVHPIRRNESGSPLGRGGVELPKKWFEAHELLFQGQVIHLSHPAKVGYYKLQQGRLYDLVDLRRLAETGKLTISDVEDIERAFMEESLVRRWANNVQSKRIAGLEQLKQWVAEGRQKHAQNTSDQQLG